MPTNQEIAQMAHLMRRAGFGATYAELEQRAAAGYEATVEELLNPVAQPDLEMDILERHFVDWKEMNALEVNQAYLTYRMINTKRPLQEKMALFWHGILCTGNSKCEHGRQIQLQLDMFRELGMGNFDMLLKGLSRDPAMVFYLDNCMSHKGAINENWGRELLELFSMGVGMDGHANYSEDDVKEAARAFTGWTITNAVPRYPYGRYESNFIYNPYDHDNEEKTFLGETGNFNGDDIVDIIARQQSAARFVSRHLYNFFVADEVQVPAWQNTPRGTPKHRAAGADVLRLGLQPDRHAAGHVQLRLLQERPLREGEEPHRGGHRDDAPGAGLHVAEAGPAAAGQHHPVHGAGPDEPAHRGGLAHRRRVDRLRHAGGAHHFAADQVGNTSLPGVQEIVSRLDSEQVSTAEGIVDRCLEMVGGYELARETRDQLVAFVGNATPGRPSTRRPSPRPYS